MSAPSTDPSRRSDVAGFLRTGLAFVLLGLAIYGGLYAAAEANVRRLADRNRFHAVRSADADRYDYVILGASHGAVLDYRDMNARLESRTESRVLNLATLGGGVAVNRLLLEYFFLTRSADVVVYVLDSFAIYSSDWNEERLRDTELYRRAPWDPALVALLLRHPAARRAALAYATGFAKINDAARFELDVFPAEGSPFDRTYRPVPQIDRQRIEFLYPDGADPSGPAAQRYFSQLEELVALSRAEGARFAVVRPPLPARMREMIPEEAAFEQALGRLLDRLGVPLLDFSMVNDDEALFHDSDHLNSEGTTRFIREHLGPGLIDLER